ncbi:hypothetical protein E4U55_001307 [Claviceps digitariae]|nr:hypothetical protein E4U55_001307 [Claviceps digitariae]
MASSDPKPVEQLTEEKKPEQKTALGEDDEFEDFPVDESKRCYFGDKRLTDEIDWPEEQTEAAQSGETKHLWEESWDDDDTTDDFSTQLK